ncbi:hypothetical protein E2C01_010801 [Portunus trituberculatus]|uniref:Uncharacterized protein n=1 Tax=Portunus trituberculatus TaxID=210409 RepID=A0A5B7D9E1_PORTR|nr:hypothetical protein [Portunus trituberculatus]
MGVGGGAGVMWGFRRLLPPVWCCRRQATHQETRRGPDCQGHRHQRDLYVMQAGRDPAAEGVAKGVAGGGVVAALTPLLTTAAPQAPRGEVRELFSLSGVSGRAG